MMGMENGGQAAAPPGVTSTSVSSVQESNASVNGIRKNGLLDIIGKAGISGEEDENSLRQSNGKILNSLA